MSQSLMPLDKRQNPDQHQQHEHIAHSQPQEHMMPGGPTQRVGRTERVPVMLRQDEVRAVDDFRFAFRCQSRSDAIRLLLQRGLQTTAREAEPKEPADAR